MLIFCLGHVGCYRGSCVNFSMKISGATMVSSGMPGGSVTLNKTYTLPPKSAPFLKLPFFWGREKANGILNQMSLVECSW